MTSLLDLPVEIFDTVIGHYVDAAGKDEAWYARGTCKTFQNTISRELFNAKTFDCYHYRDKTPRKRHGYRNGKLRYADGILRFHLAEVLKYQVSRPWVEGTSKRVLECLNEVVDAVLRIEGFEVGLGTRSMREAYMDDVIKALVHAEGGDKIPWSEFDEITNWKAILRLSAAAAVGSIKAVEQFLSAIISAEEHYDRNHYRSRLLLGSPMQAAASTGNLEILNLLLEKQNLTTMFTIYWKSEAHTPEELRRYRWTYDNGHSWPDRVRHALHRATISAIRAQRLEAVTLILSWRHENECPPSLEDWPDYLNPLVDMDSLPTISALLTLFAKTWAPISDAETRVLEHLAFAACRRSNALLLRHLLNARLVSLQAPSPGTVSINTGTPFRTEMLRQALKDNESGPILKTVLDFAKPDPFTYVELERPMARGNYKVVQVMLEYGCAISSCVVSLANFGVTKYLKKVQNVGRATLVEKVDAGERSLTAWLVYRYSKGNVYGGLGEKNAVPRTGGLEQVEAFLMGEEPWKTVVDGLVRGPGMF